MSELLPFFVTGIATGSIYALAAMGLVLTFKTSGIFNFAHGAQAAMGAYLMWDLWERHGWPWPLAALSSLLVAGMVMGVLLERLAVGLSDKPVAMRVVASVGLLVGLQGLLVLRYGDATIAMDFFLPDSLFSIGSVNVRYEQMIVALLGLASLVVLVAFFRRSRLGVAMQSVVDDPALLGLNGTSPIAVRRSAWMIGSCFAASSGALLAPTLGLDTALLTLLVVQAFGGAAVGRFSSLPLTYLGGLVVGLGQEVIKYLVTQPFLTDHLSPAILQPIPSNVPFLILFIVLLVTPTKKLLDRGGRVVRRIPPPNRLPFRTTAAATAAAAIGVLVLPHLVGARLPVYTTAAGFVIIFASLHLLVRTSSQVSLCQLTFSAVGAAAFARFQSVGVPFGFAVLLAGLVTVPVGAFVAIPAIRLSGVYLAIATFGFGILVERILFPTFLLFGAQQSLPAARPSLAASDFGYYYVTIGIAAACCVAVALVRRGRLGRMLQGLGDAPAALAAHGTSANILRTASFCLSAFLAAVGGAVIGPITAAVGGAVIGPITGSASGLSFNFGFSLTIVVVLAIAGRRAAPAAFVASGLYVVLPAHIESVVLSRYLPVFFGAAAILIACGVPGDLLQRWQTGARTRERVADATPAKSRSRLAPAVTP